MAEKQKTVACNAAAMREALVELMKFACNCCQERYCEEDIEEEDGQRIPIPCSAIIKARAALAAPARNCDRFYVAAEALAEWQRLAHIKPNAWDFRYNYWLFAPAKKEGGGK